MREFKFRAWDKDNKEMVYQNADSPSFGTFKGEKYCTLEEVFFYEKESFDIMQYTGMKDKNGKEIYEGDIVKAKSSDGREFVGHVMFGDGSFFIKNDTSSNYRWIDYEVEVIGNIHENPELLN